MDVDDYLGLSAFTCVGIIVIFEGITDKSIDPLKRVGLVALGIAIVIAAILIGEFWLSK